jgi:hypothetical protein
LLPAECQGALLIYVMNIGAASSGVNCFSLFSSLPGGSVLLHINSAGTESAVIPVCVGLGKGWRARDPEIDRFSASRKSPLIMYPVPSIFNSGMMLILQPGRV